MPRLAALRAQVRHLRPHIIGIDLFAAATMGMLTMFVVLLATLHGFDAATFEAGLRYAHREISDVTDATDGSGTNFRSTTEFFVISGSTYDAPDRIPADFTSALTPRVWTYDAADAGGADLVLGQNIIAGGVHQDSVLLDEASAASLHVSLGDTVVIRGESADCRVVVGGITRPYVDIERARGLLVAPARLCPNDFLTSSDQADEIVTFDGTSSARQGQSWPEYMGEVLFMAVGTRIVGLLPVILLIGLGLWVLVSLRASRRVRDTLELPSELLFDLGCTAARVRATHLLVSGLLVATAAVGAAWGAHEAVWRVAGFYTQQAHWLSVALVFAAATMAVTFVAHVRASREASRRPTTPTVTPPTTDKGNS